MKLATFQALTRNPRLFFYLTRSQKESLSDGDNPCEQAAPARPNNEAALTIDNLRRDLASFNARDPQFATLVVDRLLAAARESQASDLHLLPTSEALDVRWRVDGVLEPLAAIPSQLAPNVIARLKVLAGLLTYRTDTPQEGRRRASLGGHGNSRVNSLPRRSGAV